MYYLSMDGGGTKLLGLLFDHQYRLIATARVAGTHRSIYPEAEIRAHIRQCYDLLFADLPRPLHIETVYGLCGDSDLYAALLPEGITLGRVRTIVEPVSALYAGTQRSTGFIALSGTGSDVFCIRDGVTTDFIGGWGAILGDEGSGVWLSLKAIQTAIRADDGWGPPSLFGRMVLEHYGFTRLREYTTYLYDATAPFRRLAELLPLAAQAANAGDEAVLEVFRSGGRILAEQMIHLLRRNPNLPPHITACGGAWKAHGAMAQAFTEAVQAEFPHATFTLPRFEHIMAGPISLAMEQGEDLTAIILLLEQHFPTFLWNQGENP